MLTKFNIPKIVKFVIWIAGLYASIFISMEKIYFIVSCFYFIFTNLGKRKQGELSAYSVFNKNFEKLPGTFSADQFLTGRASSSNEQKNQIMNEQQHEKAKIVDEYYKNQSKFGNKPCFCGSSLKFKKCCLMKERLKQKQKKIN